jgi:hypothetical protein
MEPECPNHYARPVHFYRDDIGSSEASSDVWPGPDSDLELERISLFKISISESGCGYGTAAVGPDRADPNCDEPPTPAAGVQVGEPEPESSTHPAGPAAS